MTSDDVNVVHNCNLTAIRQYENHPGNLIDRVFLTCIEFLTARNDLKWLGFGFFTWRDQKILDDLDEEQSLRVLDAMFLAPNLEGRGEELLAGIAEVAPSLVLSFLGRRLALEDSDTRPTDYRAIPYSLYSLNKPLARSADRLIVDTRKWFDADKSLFEYHGGRLVATVFPDFPENLEASLRAEIADENPASIEFVLEILRGYQGMYQVFPLCREIVAILDPDNKLIGSVRMVLYSSGALVGEHGSALALAEKRKALSEWLDDSRTTVRTFAERFIHSLEQSMAQERRQADQRVAMRKLSFDK